MVCNGHTPYSTHVIVLVMMINLPSIASCYYCGKSENSFAKLDKEIIVMLIDIAPEATYCIYYWPILHIKCDVRHGKFGKFSFNASITRVPWSRYAACTGNLFQHTEKSAVRFLELQELLEQKAATHMRLNPCLRIPYHRQLDVPI